MVTFLPGHLNLLPVNKLPVNKLSCLVCPPTSHNPSQPLDKSSQRKVCHSFAIHFSSEILGELYDFSSLLCEAWDEAMWDEADHQKHKKRSPPEYTPFVLPKEQFEEFKPEANIFHIFLFTVRRLERKPAYRSSIGSEDIESPISTHISTHHTSPHTSPHT